MMTFNPQEHMTNLKGKDYLEVKWRLVWFRDEHPNGAISTEVLSFDPLLVKASIHSSEGALLATGHASATAKAGAVWSGRDFEKAETAAIGRALGHAGYGTQFEPDGEGDYLADSPIDRRPENTAQKSTNNAPATPKGKTTHTELPQTPEIGSKRTFAVIQLETVGTADKPYYKLTATDNAEILTFSRDLFRSWGWAEELTDSIKTPGFKTEVEVEVEARLIKRKDKSGTYWAALIPKMPEVIF